MFCIHRRACVPHAGVRYMSQSPIHTCYCDSRRVWCFMRIDKIWELKHILSPGLKPTRRHKPDICRALVVFNEKVTAFSFLSNLQNCHFNSSFSIVNGVIVATQQCSKVTTNHFRAVCQHRTVARDRIKVRKIMFFFDYSTWFIFELLLITTTSNQNVILEVWSVQLWL